MWCTEKQNENEGRPCIPRPQSVDETDGLAPCINTMLVPNPNTQ